MCVPSNSIILLPLSHHSSPTPLLPFLNNQRSDPITRPPPPPTAPTAPTAAATKSRASSPVLSPRLHLTHLLPKSSRTDRNPKTKKESKKMEVEAPRQRSNTSSPSSSPEFEFWMVRNPSFPPSNLLTADELFLDGVLLPLQLLSLPPSDRPAQPPSPSTAAPPAEPSPSPSPSSILVSSSATSSSLSRRWKDLFKVSPEKKPAEKEHQEKSLRKKDRKSSADLNINLNIWPFTRSQSAGGRPRSTGSVSGRKVSSAPCSRSNSRGESAVGRRWAASPGRGGVHLARPTPVWQIRRAGMGPKEKSRMWAQAASAGGGRVGAGARVLNLNVNSCIGHGEKVSSRGDDSDGITGGDRIVEGSGANGRETSVFSLRALFSKKVY